MVLDFRYFLKDESSRDASAKVIASARSAWARPAVAWSDFPPTAGSVTAQGMTAIAASRSAFRRHRNDSVAGSNAGKRKPAVPTWSPPRSVSFDPGEGQAGKGTSRGSLVVGEPTLPSLSSRTSDCASWFSPRRSDRVSSDKRMPQGCSSTNPHLGSVLFAAAIFLPSFASAFRLRAKAKDEHGPPILGLKPDGRHSSLGTPEPS